MNSSVAGGLTASLRPGGMSSRILTPASGGSVTQLIFHVQPDGAVAGAQFTQQPVVYAADSDGNPVASFTGNIDMMISSGPGGATLSGTTTVPCIAGVATFTNLSLDTAGEFTLGASGDMFAVQSDSFFVLPAGMSILFATHSPGSAVPTGLYKDAAGTVPATDEGDPIKCLRQPINGNTIVATQTDSGKIGTLSYIDGFPVIVSDGATSVYNIASQAWFPGKRGTLIGVYMKTDGTFGDIMATFPGSGVDFQWLSASSGDAYKWYDNVDLVLATLESNSAWQREILTRTTDTNLNRLHNGSSSDLTIANNQPSNDPATIFATPSDQNRFGGYLVALMYSDLVFSAGDKAVLDAFCAALTVEVIGHYLRPGAFYTYLRPGGVDTYERANTPP